MRNNQKLNGVPSIGLFPAGVPSFDAQPLKVAAYTTQTVGEDIHTLTINGVNNLEMTYVTVTVQNISPADTGGYFNWDSTTCE